MHARHVKHTQSTQKAALASIKPHRRRDRLAQKEPAGPTEVAARLVQHARRANAPGSSLASVQVCAVYPACNVGVQHAATSRVWNALSWLEQHIFACWIVMGCILHVWTQALHRDLAGAECSPL